MVEQPEILKAIREVLVCMDSILGSCVPSVHTCLLYVATSFLLNGFANQRLK